MNGDKTTGAIKPRPRKRKSKPQAYTLAKVNRPPESLPWMWFTKERLTSPAWRCRSFQCMKFLEFLEVENLKFGGARNGELLATYDQLAAFGLLRRTILSTIDEAEALGLVEVRAGFRGAKGVAAANRYRLTYTASLATDINGAEYYIEATNEWRKITAEAAAAATTRASHSRTASRQEKRDERYPRGNSDRDPCGNSAGVPRGNSLRTTPIEIIENDRVPAWSTTLNNLPPQQRNAHSEAPSDHEPDGLKSSSHDHESEDRRILGPTKLSKRAFAQTLIDTRKSAGLSIDEAGLITGFGAKGIQNIEAGKATVAASARERLINQLAGAGRREETHA